jgi:hypothetical protein
MQEAEVVLSVLRERGWVYPTRPRTRHKSLESPVHRKDARRVRREAVRKRPGSLGCGTSPRSPPYVRHEAHCYIAREAGGDERRYLWI